MTARLFVQETLLTRPVTEQISVTPPDQVQILDRLEPGCFALVESGFLPQLEGYQVDAACGISLRDCGLVRFCSPLRPDELDDPAIRLQTDSLTTELLARATLPGYFGFTPHAWIAGDADRYDAIVLDEIAGISPIESAFADDVTRGWFVLTGVPFVSHILAVPSAATAEDREAVTNLVHESFEGDLERTAAYAVAQGAERNRIEAVLDDVATVMTGDERLGIAELFRRCGIETGFRGIDWALES